MTTAERLRQIAESSPLAHLDIDAGRVGGSAIQLQFDRTDASATHTGSARRRFLTASLTKPVVALQVLQLVAEGVLCLSDRVSDHLPPFNRSGLRRLTVRHLLTHTSGLPDMLPDNEQLRASHASLQEFANGAATVTPGFEPGTDSRYSSMGFAVLAGLVERVTGRTLRQIMAADLFQALDLRSIWLGVPADGDELASVLPNELPSWQPPDCDWNWNSRYWRTLGAPWGGLISTAEDLGRLAQILLSDGRLSDGTAVISPATIRESFRNQTACFADIAEPTRRARGWGFGWRHNWPDHHACFGDLLPPDAVGHWGATGTLMWIDPRSATWAVLLTTTPWETSRLTLQRLSNVLATALAADNHRDGAP